MSRISRYIVGKGYGGTCGSFSMIYAKDEDYPQWGYHSLIPDRGYKEGDKVEQCCDDYGNMLWTKCNGVIIQKYDAEAEKRQHEEYMRETLSSKGIKHPIYNP